MPATARYSLRYPAPAARMIAGGAQIKDLAEDADAAIAAVAAAGQVTRRVKPAGQDRFTASAAAVDGLSAPVPAAGQYHVRALLRYAGAGTAGFPAFGCITPAAAGFLASGIFQAAFAPFAVTAATLDSGSPAFGGPALAGPGNFFLFTFDMTATFSAAGDVVMRAFRSTSPAGSDFTVSAGSWLEVARVA